MVIAVAYSKHSCFLPLRSQLFVRSSSLRGLWSSVLVCGMREHPNNQRKATTTTGLKETIPLHQCCVAVAAGDHDCPKFVPLTLNLHRQIFNHSGRYYHLAFWQGCQNPPSRTDDKQVGFQLQNPVMSTHRCNLFPLGLTVVFESL